MSKTIMLVHGAWVTTDCWTSFRDFLQREWVPCCRFLLYTYDTQNNANNGALACSNGCNGPFAALKCDF